MRYHNTAIMGAEEPKSSAAVPSFVEQTLIAVFGVKNHLTTGQECARAVLIFFYGLALLRLCGARMFGQ